MVMHNIAGYYHIYYSKMALDTGGFNKYTNTDYTLVTLFNLFTSRNTIHALDRIFDNFASFLLSAALISE